MLTTEQEKTQEADMPQDGEGPRLERSLSAEEEARDQERVAAEELATILKEAAQAAGKELRSPQKVQTGANNDACVEEKLDNLSRAQAQALHDLAEQLRGEFENSAMMLRMEVQQAQLSFANALQVQRKDFEGLTADLRKDIEQKHPSVKSYESGADSRITCVEQEMAKLRSQTEELADSHRVLQRDSSETTNSIRRELMRLTELTVGCLSKVGDMPTEMESLRRDVRSLQQHHPTRSGSPGMVSEPIAVQQQSLPEEPIGVQQREQWKKQQHQPQQLLIQQHSPKNAPPSPMHDAAWREERKSISREMATVRVEILRAKDLFLSGQTSAGLVLKDLELLRQDVGRLKQGAGITSGMLSDDNLRVMREQLWLELREELKALVDPVINPNNFSRNRPQRYYMGENSLE